MQFTSSMDCPTYSHTISYSSAFSPVVPALHQATAQGFTSKVLTVAAAWLPRAVTHQVLLHLRVPMG